MMIKDFFCLITELKAHHPIKYIVFSLFIWFKRPCFLRRPYSFLILFHISFLASNQILFQAAYKFPRPASLSRSTFHCIWIVFLSIYYGAGSGHAFRIDLKQKYGFTYKIFIKLISQYINNKLCKLPKNLSN